MSCMLPRQTTPSLGVGLWPCFARSTTLWRPSFPKGRVDSVRVPREKHARTGKATFSSGEFCNTYRPGFLLCLAFARSHLRARTLGFFFEEPCPLVSSGLSPLLRKPCPWISDGLFLFLCDKNFVGHRSSLSSDYFALYYHLDDSDDKSKTSQWQFRSANATGSALASFPNCENEETLVGVDSVGFISHMKQFSETGLLIGLYDIEYMKGLVSFFTEGRFHRCQVSFAVRFHLHRRSFKENDDYCTSIVYRGLSVSLYRSS